MTKWNYGDAYKRYPIENEHIFDNGSRIKVHNIFDPLPEFMKEADLIFCDPPWNLGNLNTFYTKADKSDYQKDFKDFYMRLFECIKEINPKTCYIEVGKEYLAEFIIELKKQFKSVTFYNNTYSHNNNLYCYIIRASNKYKKLPLNNIDQREAIEWICKNETYTCIGDLCLGRGLVGYYAYNNNKKFVGTELNHKRLSVLIKRITEGKI